MPRDGALTLSDVREPTLTIVCEPCARRGRYAVARLLEEHGDAKLTDLLGMLATVSEDELRQRLTIDARRYMKGSGLARRAPRTAIR